MEHTVTSFNLKLQGSFEDIQVINEVFQNVGFKRVEEKTVIYPYEKLISQDPSFPDDVQYREDRFLGWSVIFPHRGNFPELSNNNTTLSLEFGSSWYPTVRFVKFLCQQYRLSASLSFSDYENYFDGRFVFDCHGHITNIKLDESIDRYVFMELSRPRFLFN